MNKQILLTEIGPRDGFQNVSTFIPTQTKLKIIEGIIDSGVKKIQLTSFISPKAIPQMKDASEICHYILDKYTDVDFFALVPNLKGAELAVAAGLKEISPVLSLSESHNKANVNKSVQESLNEIVRIREQYPDIKITQDIATVFGCPFEGVMPIESLLSLMEKLKDIGIRDFTLCDTIGVATPNRILDTIQAVRKTFENVHLNIHIHDTRNMGILNTYLAINAGVDGVQTSLGGLGGCPFAPGASGNTSTEDLVYMLNHSGYDTGINFEKILGIAKYTKSIINGNYSGHHINIEIQQCNF